MSRDMEVLTMLDVIPKQGFSIEVSDDERTFWVNVDGICRLRLNAPLMSSFVEIETGEYLVTPPKLGESGGRPGQG